MDNGYVDIMYILLHPLYSYWQNRLFLTFETICEKVQTRNYNFVVRTPGKFIYLKFRWGNDNNRSFIIHLTTTTATMWHVGT